jgi:ferrochelatase
VAARLDDEEYTTIAMNQNTQLLDTVHGQVPAVGVLLTNVGSPAAPTRKALTKYLAQFLSDPRVIENQGLVWKLILHGIILRTRPKRSAHAYQQIWTEEGSPLLAIARKQARGIATALAQRIGSPLHVAVGMGYGTPSVAEALVELREKGCRRVLVLPLFPQYAAATVGSTFDGVTGALSRWRWVPELRMIGQYHDEPAYIQALAASVREVWEKGGRPDRLLMSFHGLPKRCLLEGDPYHCQCHKTARLLADSLELSSDFWMLAFQSRFGKEIWLRPYTDETLKTWGREGVKKVDVICPGFSADCLETIEEIGAENRDYFLSAGGKSFRYIPALNARADHIEALAELAMRHLAGWVVPSSDWDGDRALQAARLTEERARDKQREGLNN